MRNVLRVFVNVEVSWRFIFGITKETLGHDGWALRRCYGVGSEDTLTLGHSFSWILSRVFSVFTIVGFRWKKEREMVREDIGYTWMFDIFLGC